MKITFDGDTASGNIVYSDEAIEEVKAFFASRKAYVGADGAAINDTNTSTIALVLHNMTGP